MIEIWTPRYHDNVVLIATYKVKNGENRIQFTKANHLKGMTFKAMGEDIRNCPIDTNGRIECFAVPMSMLERVE